MKCKNRCVTCQPYNAKWHINHIFLWQVYAWKIADELLARKVDLNSCYLAAQTMRSKLQNSFHELPQDSHASLRDALLNHLSKLDDTTDGVIATQVLILIYFLFLKNAQF